MRMMLACGGEGGSPRVSKTARDHASSNLTCRSAPGTFTGVQEARTTAMMPKGLRNAATGWPPHQPPLFRLTARQFASHSSGNSITADAAEEFLFRGLQGIAGACRHLCRRLPDFYVVGCPKCGITTIYHYLTLHPRIVEPAYKVSRFILGRTHGAMLFIFCGSWL